MKLKVLASGSKANSYILENETEALIIEAGVPFKELIRHVDHRKIVGCLVSHEHQDHAKYLKEYKERGIEMLYPFAGNYEGNYYTSRWVKRGSFEVRAFENHHNVKCYGFCIFHIDCGPIVFSTDTGYIEYKYHNIRHWLIECNYSKEILDQRVEQGFNPSLADRIVKDHMSLETCKDFFKANDLSKTRNIVLLHLSDSNSDSKQFKDEIYSLTNKPTYIAEKGLEIDLSLCPF
ncbi:MAG: MBL fold metallo-hydrolase [Clostridiales bacterium]|uniref:hypothetical protein n=1 Tax=Zhenhengia sp. TaxID=2944208 RepID=UPI002911CD07|nr:MBL fold metallo-hydrolase [Clostridiales bacterium]